MWNKPYIKIYSKTFQNIKRKDIWNIWTDINNWPQWHGDLDYCKLEGSFEEGNYFILKPKGIKPVKIIITKINKGYSFTDCTTFFGAKMYDTHSMEETQNGLKITNKLVVTGPLKWIWIKLVAQNVADTIPEEMESLAKLARGKNV